jgi:hypothetical protein
MTEALEEYSNTARELQPLCLRNGIHIFNEKEIEKAIKFIGYYANILI